MKNLSRICIFVFYDPQGIVDPYVIHLLDALRPRVRHLMVISNGPLENIQQQKLLPHCDELRFRENRGMDAAAFRDGMVKFCGWDRLAEYDETVLVNDTFFGPIHSFCHMFDTMAEKDLDFWGMSAGYEQEDGWGMSRYGYVPDHIQTFFVAFRKNMVLSQAFQDYWNRYDTSMQSFREVVSGHEMIMTRHFADLGFRWDIYADTKKYHSDFREENFNIYFYRSHEMMEDLHFPVFKKKVLSADMKELLYMNDLEDAAGAMDYIENHSDYDSNLIFDNVLRLYSVEDLYHSLHLNFVLPSEPGEPLQNAALVFCLTEERFADRFLKRALELSEQLPVYLAVHGESLRKQVSESIKGRLSLHLLPDSGQDTEMGSLLLSCRELIDRYEYLGFLHDLQNPDHIPATVPESAVLGFLQNTAKDSAYLQQIFRTFRAHPRLGILAAPCPIHHSYFENYNDGWDGTFHQVRKLSEELHLTCRLSPEKQPIMNTGCFWARTKALLPLTQKVWKKEDFRRNPLSLQSLNNEVLKRILPYAAQSAGFFSGIVMHTDFASMRITGQELMLQDLVHTTKQNLGITSETYIGYRDQLGLYGTGAPDGKVTVDLSDLGVRFLIKHIITRYLPGKTMKLLRNLQAFHKRRSGKK